MLQVERDRLNKTEHTRSASNYIADIIDKYMVDGGADYCAMSRIANDITDVIEEGISGMIGFDEVAFKKSLAIHLENVMRKRFFKE